MRDQRRTAVGEDIIAATLRGGAQTRGIIVDNPSGSWLFVTPVNDYVPPYKLGWARSLQSGTLAVDVRFEDGPAGQVSTLAGDPVTLWLDEDPVGSSAGADSGAAFIEQFTPPHGAVASLGVSTGNPTVYQGLVVNDSVVVWDSGVDPAPPTLILGVPNRRIRVLALYPALVIRRNVLGPAQDSDSGADVLISNNGAGIYELQVTLMPASLPSANIVFPGGQDFATGESVIMFVSPHWSDITLRVNAMYQVI